MKTTQTVKTIKEISNSGMSQGISSGTGSGDRTITKKTTKVISGAGGNQPGLLRRSSRGSRVWRKTVLGEEFKYSEKLKEKMNYILYASGMGHERNLIQEIEEEIKLKPEPKQKVIEIRQIIDNYGYHETKNVTKNDPRRLSLTHHERLSTPFERTTLKKFSAYTTAPKPRGYISTSVEKTRFDTDNGIKTSTINKYNSFTTKQQKNKTTIPAKIYETYKPTKTEYTKTTRTIENKAPNTLLQERNKINTQTQITKTKTEISKFTDRRGEDKNEPKYQPKVQPKYQPKIQPKTQPNYQPKYQPKAQPQAQPQAQPKNESKYQPKAQPKAQPKYQPKTQPQAQPKIQPQAQLKNEPKYQQKAQPNYQPKYQPKTQPQSQPKNESNYQPKTQSNYQPKTQQNYQPKYQPKAQPQAQPKNEPKYQPKTQPKAQPKYQSKTQPKNEPKYQPKYQPHIKTEIGDNQTKTETTQDGEYVVKVTTTRTQVGKYGKPEEIRRGGSAPRTGERPRNEGFGTPNQPQRFGRLPGFIPPHGPHGFIPPHGPFGPHGFIPPHGHFGPHHGFEPHGPHGPIPRMAPKSEERSKSLERPHVSHSPHGFMSPHGPHGFGGSHGFMPPHGPFGGPHHGFEPHGPFGPHGFMPPH